MLVKAVRRLLRRERYSDVTLAAILAESGLHTRAFYRHFQTKDEVLLAIYQEDAEKLHEILTGRIDAAVSPTDGILAWIDEMLRLQFDPRAIAFISTFRERAASEAMERLGAGKVFDPLLVEPLIRVLVAGRDDGSLPNAVPEVHAAFIYALVWHGLDSIPGRRREDRWAEARRLVVDFTLSALCPERKLLPQPGGPASSRPTGALA
jgi:AcrR family transcriptional regulator